MGFHTVQIQATNGAYQAIDRTNQFNCDGLLHQLDDLGALSGVAQELKVPITSFEKFISSDHAIILIMEESSRETLQGYIKYGYKDLYFYTSKGKVVQKSKCLCLLDFYVQESLQRTGLGKRLFESFLEVVEVSPQHVAYDRPSKRLLPFLSKHYNMNGPDHQPNRFTIYPGFPL